MPGWCNFTCGVALRVRALVKCANVGLPSVVPAAHNRLQRTVMHNVPRHERRTAAERGR